MKLELDKYLLTIKSHLQLDTNSEKDIIMELEAHVADSCQEMQSEGLSENEALEKCLKLLGPAKTIAYQIYEAHNQSTWRQALLAALPHLFFAVMFALKWLMGISWLPVVIAIVLSIGIYGRSQGKPDWLFPWLSYSLLPVAAAGVSLLYLPTAWSWVTLSLYIPLALWLLSFITIKFMRRDWLYSALMLLPAVAFTGWFMATEQKILFPGLQVDSFYDFAPWTGFTFMVLGVSVALFIKFSQRWIKIAALITSGVITSLVTTLASHKLGLVSFIGLILLISSFLIVPAFIEHRARRSINL